MATLRIISLLLITPCHALLLPPSSRSATSLRRPQSTLSISPTSEIAKNASPRSRIICITRLHADANNEDDDEEQHLHGIGVGIDLGTTNSAVAMMIPADKDGGNGSRTLPRIIEIEHDGRTIPSVVAFVPTSENDEEELNNNELSLPPWTDQIEPATLPSDTLRWPTTDSTSDGQYQIRIGKSAIQYEQHHPNSTYRNVKRVIGTGGRMAELASGVVPNLFIQSVNGGVGNDGLSSDSLDALFDMLEGNDGGGSKKKKKGKNNKNKEKGKGRWKKKKQNELPKLQRQLDDAKDDPALLSCNMAAEAPEVLLRPEQISACILRKLYDTAERNYQQRRGDSNNDVVKVTRAVIGVPAYFTEAQRQATIRASELAGVPKVKLLPEPEAAALAYGSASSEKKKGSTDDLMDEELILVFDLGGGTFDVSILEVGGGVTEVLATVGNNRLGGTDFDKRVAEYLSGSAVEFGRKKKLNSQKEEKKKNEESLDDRLEDDADSLNGRKRNRGPIKDWYHHGTGEVPDIILRVAEEARKSLSNQKVVEVLVPLTEDGWRRVVGGSSDEENDSSNESTALGSMIVGSLFDKAKLESEQDLIEDEDYTIVTLDRNTFESICYNELQMLLQPIREVAIMAGVLLPGEARPSFVENAMAMATTRDEAWGEEEDGGEDFWDFENEEDDLLLVKTAGKDGESTMGISFDASTTEDEILNEQALQQIQAMDIKSQKKAQQRGRRKARDTAKRERSFRKQKQVAMEDATTASLLGKQLGGGKKGRAAGGGIASSSQQSAATSVRVGNERVQEGIHGRPLSRIVLVGGATRMPVIAKLLEAVVGMVPQRTVNPDEAVALGCAVQVGILDGENEGLLGGMQAVLSPMQAAVMRALAKKRGMDVVSGGVESSSGELMTMMDGEDDEMDNNKMMMMGGISGMVVDAFDDEDDFY